MDTMNAVAAQEVALHMAMCVNAEYVHAWGLQSFLEKLSEYTAMDCDLDDIQLCVNHLEDEDDE